MWSTGVSRPPSALRRVPGFRHGGRHWDRAPRFISLVMRDVSSMATNSLKKEVNSKEEIHIERPVPKVEVPSSTSPSDLRFDKLQVSDPDSGCRQRREFGQFVASEAVLDEEFWTAAWLRAESHWENKSGSRYVDSYKKKFAEQEFASLKRRSSEQYAQKSTCIVAVKKEKKNVKQTILKSIVGTLDINKRYLLQGETFPGERGKAPVMFNTYRTDQPRYGYVANLVVAKYARRRGIASNLLHLAIDAAREYGVDPIFVHVHRDNMSAQKLYEKMGFKMVRTDMQHLEDCNYLLCFKD